MSVGFGVAWIPVLGFVAFPFLVWGFMKLLLGCHWFTREHRWGLIAAFWCYSSGLLMTLAIVFFAHGADPVVFLGWIALAYGVSTLGFVLIPYSLSDVYSRLILWIAYLLSLSLLVLEFGNVWNAVYGVVLNPGSMPVVSPLTTAFFAGISQAIPYALLVWVYTRTRHQIQLVVSHPSAT